MKTLLIAIACLIASKGFSQTSELKVEEKSSDWITITAPATVAKPKAITTTKKKVKSTKPQPKKQEEQEFEKTNNQVNRFKKKQG